MEQASTASPPSSSDVSQKLKTGKQLTEAEREELAEKGKLPRDPNDHSGEQMKMHGGSSSDSEKTERAESVAHEGGGEHGKETGTGQKHVYTSGFAADGGDFDASKPGAGKEATRLLEEQGIKRDNDDRGELKMPAGTGEAPKEKQSLAEKIKDKLHIGSGKHV
jgi:hypothetical protein